MNLKIETMENGFAMHSPRKLIFRKFSEVLEAARYLLWLERNAKMLYNNNHPYKNIHISHYPILHDVGRKKSKR